MVLAAALRPLLLWAGVGWGEYEQGWSARNMGRGGVGETCLHSLCTASLGEPQTPGPPASAYLVPW